MNMLNRDDHILFIGDSITHAHRRPEEFHDCYQLGCGYVNHLAGVLQLRHPDLNLRVSNRGECGHGLPELSKRWERDCLSLQPQVVSILVGINDANPGRKERGHALEPVAYQRDYTQLLERTRAGLPHARLILLEPFCVAIPATFVAPVQIISSEWIQRARALQPLVRPLAERFGATFVPLQASFDELAQRIPPQHLARDGIHPTTLGHALIAQQWLKHVVGSSHPLAELTGTISP